MIITEIQKKEIEQLIPEHGDALLAYGADMYRQGTIAGAVFLGERFEDCDQFCLRSYFCKF